MLNYLRLDRKRIHLLCDDFLSTLALLFDELSPKIQPYFGKIKNTSNTNNVTYIPIHLEL